MIVDKLGSSFFYRSLTILDTELVFYLSYFTA